VFAPSAEDGLSLATYTHPSGAFSLDIPTQWVSYPQTSESLAAVMFSLPGATEPHLRVVTIQLDETDQNTDTTLLIDAYQQGIRADSEAYSEQSRTQLADGSWRLTGVGVDSGGNPQAINTFVLRDETLFSVLEVIYPVEATDVATTELAVNTLRVNEAAQQLTPTSLLTLSTVNATALEVINMAAWTTDAGVFFVTGEVANRLEMPVTSAPIQLFLLDNVGNVIIEAADVTMGHGIVGNGFAPFSLRFGEGRPTELDAFNVTLGDDAWQDTLREVDFIQGGALSGTSTTTLANGQLTVEGSVTNNSSQPVADVLAVITVFDDQQRVIAGRFFPLADEPIAPGDSVDYAVLIPELGGTPVDFIVEFQGVVDE